MTEVIVEFYGVPRQRAQRAELPVRATTAGEALQAVEAACPALRVLERGALAKHVRLSLDGRRFITDLGERLPEGARLLLLSADAGG